MGGSDCDLATGGLRLDPGNSTHNGIMIPAASSDMVTLYLHRSTQCLGSPYVPSYPSWPGLWEA